MVSSAMIDTICKELCKEKTPMKFVYEVVGEEITECEDLYTLLYSKCVVMPDDKLKHFYDRLLYHTRYKNQRKQYYKRTKKIHIKESKGD